MDDKDILQMLEKYEKKKLEIGSNYNIKKEELEKNYNIKKEELAKEHKMLQIDNKFKLLNYLSRKEEEIKKKLEGIRQIRNALFEDDEDEGMRELNNMAKENKATFENDNNSQGIQLREGTEINGMKKTNINEEKEEKEGKKKKGEFEEEEEFEEKERKELQMTNKKRDRPFKEVNN